MLLSLYRSGFGWKQGGDEFILKKEIHLFLNKKCIVDDEEHTGLSKPSTCLSLLLIPFHLSLDGAMTHINW